ncbi:MAG: adenylate kinase [Erysipelotrichaceae bacterium]|nr:adenylate kinase [Erysipelotrichaceae bacterium]
MNILIMGPAGSGKGTMSERIRDHFQIPHISTGDMFRENIKKKTGLGLTAQSYINDGKLVPDSLTVAMVKDRINKDDCSVGYLLDGFPRSLPQAMALGKIAVDDKAVQIVLNLTIPFDELVSRITGRRLCRSCGSIYHIASHPSKVEGVCDHCGGELYQRSDDTVESLKVRLNEYEMNTRPVLDYYSKKGLVVDIDASLPIEEVWQQVKKALGE